MTHEDWPTKIFSILGSIFGAIATFAAAALGIKKMVKLQSQGWKRAREAKVSREKALDQLLPSLDISHPTLIDQIRGIANRLTHIEIAIEMLGIEHQASFELLGLAIWHSDHDGKAVYISPTLGDLLGMSTEEARGWGWLTSVHTDDRKRVRNEYVYSVMDKRPFSEYYRFKRSNDQRIVYVHGLAYPVVPSASEIQTVKFIGRALEVSKEEWLANMKDKDELGST